MKIKKPIQRIFSKVMGVVMGASIAMIGSANAQTVDGGIIVNGLPNNTLTASETEDGYELLWNGKDYTGWALNNNKSNPGAPDAAGNWTIVNLKGVESGDKHKSAS
ncbi:MAG: hypothetical protein ABIW76_09995, partial [Fibrobacteria bacterium]